MPDCLGCQFKKQRMAAIAKEVSKGNADLYLIQELWNSRDHKTIKTLKPKKFAMTGFRELSQRSFLSFKRFCLGRGPLAPFGCSGLSIISRYPFKEVEFHAFKNCGSRNNVRKDGECFARKGVGRVQIEPMPNVTLDVFVTHTVGDPDLKHGYSNSVYLKKQIKELMERRILKSKADLIILGADLNAAPSDDKDSVYQLVLREMHNSVQEVFCELGRWRELEYTTWGNPNNTFINREYDPMMIDYIFRRTNHPEKVRSWTSSFGLPFFKTHVNGAGIISLSDHEAIQAEIKMCTF